MARRKKVPAATAQAGTSEAGGESDFENDVSLVAFHLDFKNGKIKSTAPKDDVLDEEGPDEEMIKEFPDNRPQESGSSDSEPDSSSSSSSSQFDVEALTVQLLQAPLILKLALLTKVLTLVLPTPATTPHTMTVSWHSQANYILNLHHLSDLFMPTGILLKKEHLHRGL